MSSTNDPLADQDQQPMASPSVTFTILSAAPYHTQNLTVHEATHQVHAQLQNGTHTFVSEDLRLGVVHSVEDQALLGRVSFTYTFDSDQGNVIVCDTNFASSHGMHLITTLEGTEHFCIARAAAAGFPEDDISSSRGWNFRTHATPGAAAIFQSMARNASDSLIAALKEIPGLAVLQRTPLPDLSQEEWAELGIVVRHDGMLDMYDPPTDGNLRGPVGSTIRPGGIITLPRTANFANVDGSTGDKRPGGTSWRNLWEVTVNRGGVAKFCASQNYKGFKCNNNYRVVGGHVIKGMKAGKVTYGSDKVAFIIPICDSHNKPAHDKDYMSPIKYTIGVWLYDYHI